MEIKIEYSNGQKYKFNISEKAVEDTAACILDSVHNTTEVVIICPSYSIHDDRCLSCGAKMFSE